MRGVTRAVRCNADGGYYEKDSKEGFKPVSSFLYVWNKSHALASWLRGVSSKPFRFVEGDSRFYGSIEGWEALKQLETLTKYYCTVHGVKCELVNEGLREHLGHEIVAIVNNAVLRGVVEHRGQHFVYTFIVKQGNAWGIMVNKWDFVEDVSRV